MAKVARSSFTTQNINSLRVHKLKVFLQTVAGSHKSELFNAPISEDDQNIEYAVYIDGRFSQSGFVQPDGSITVYMPSAKQVELRLLGSQYSLLPPINLPPPNTEKGVKQRLYRLGYCGENETEDKVKSALLHFQLDQKLPPNTNLSNNATCSALSQAALPSEQRIVPVQFERCSLEANVDTFLPHTYPPFDAEKADFNQACALVSMAPQSTMQLTLKRANIAANSPLFLSSSNPDLLTVVKPDTTIPLAEGTEQIIEITSGCIQETENLYAMEMAYIDVRYGADDGVIIGRLGVCLLPRIYINVQAYLVNIHGREKKQSIPLESSFPFKKVIQNVKHFWLQYGIQLNVAAPEEINLTLAESQHMHIDEINHVLNTHYAENHINVYFIPHIKGLPETSKTNQALAFTPKEYQGFYLKKDMPLRYPALFFETGKSHNIAQNERLLAMKLGHFFGLDSVHCDADFSPQLLAANLMYIQQDISQQAMPYLTLRDISYQDNSTVKTLPSQCLSVRHFLLSKFNAPYYQTE
jgi:hypothetical protein